MAGLYIHIPFCKTRCIYCGFFSTTFSLLQDDYINALIKELKSRENDYDNDKGFSTLYLGGGTPSQLSIEQLARLLAHIHTLPDAERTIECNPDDINEEYAEGLLSLGFNRISLGIQSFDDERLRFIHRRHNSQKAIEATEILKKSGFTNISIDLMFGFPNQTLQQWAKDIDKAISLHVKHLSSYCLSYEEGTILEKMLKSGEVKEADDEILAEMYTLLCDKLKEAGYEHYEISNFALAGYQSKHNSSYWYGKPYLGIGAGAHSYNGTNRRWNISNLKEYIRAIIIENNKHSTNYYQYEDLSTKDKYNELIMIRLRTSEGINPNEIPDAFRQYFLTKVESYLNKGLMEYKKTNIRLTTQALFISDSIISDLFN